MRNGLVFCVLIGALGGGCAPPPRGPSDANVLRVALSREPATWNRLLASDYPTHVVTDQLHAPLIRLNQETQQMEPALASAWEFSADGRELTFVLRKGVRFSDGEPFTAADVVFTFEVLHDPAVASPLRDTAVIEGESIVARAVDEHTVVFDLAKRTGAVERIFDSIRILPKHRYAESLAAGTLPADTGLGALPQDIVGLGPFRLKQHVPGQRIVLERNPNYYESGYPRLAGVVFDVLPDPNAQILRFRAGELDLLEPIAPEAFADLRRDEPDGATLADLGPGMAVERFWLNLNPESPIEEHKKAWFEDVRFRRALSLALDRESMARVVYHGFASAAAGPVSPANRFWTNASIPPTEQNVEKARRLLEDAGFRWHGETLVDAAGHEVRFTIITNAGNDQRRQEAAFIQEDLRALGMEITVTIMDGGALFARVTGSFDYDACLLGLSQTDPDPTAEAALWFSSAPLHLWHPGQAAPATEWEARIDRLMESVLASTDAEERKACFDEVQQIVSEQLPLFNLVVPHALVGYSAALGGIRATPFAHSLWNAEELDVELYTEGKIPRFQTVTEVTDRGARRE